MKNKWISDNTRPSSTMFRCPYCNGLVYYNHGATSRSNAEKECLYKYCPWCKRTVIEERKHTATYEGKCGACKWLDMEDRSTVGFMCVSPHRNGIRITRYRKYGTTPKCSHYEE